MDRKRFAKPLAVATALFFLFAAPALIRARAYPRADLPARPTQILHETSPAARAKKTPAQTDIVAGLQYTDDQKAQISKIHQDMKSRMDAAVKDDKLSPEQKGRSSRDSSVWSAARFTKC